MRYCIKLLDLTLVRNNLLISDINRLGVNKLLSTALVTFLLRLPQSKVCYTGEVLLSVHGHLFN